MHQPTAERGTYALLLAAAQQVVIPVGRFGRLDVRPGIYIYVGSALGPGGLAARIARHARDEKKFRWHIDHLRAVTRLEEVWCVVGKTRQECLWAKTLARMKRAEIPMEGFGASDCTCRCHLFYFPTRPSLRQFCRALKDATGTGRKPFSFAVVGAARPSGPGKTRPCAAQQAVAPGPLR